MTSAHLTDELRAHSLLGQMYQQSDRPEIAVSHYIVAGAAEDASTVAGQLGKYLDIYAEAQASQYQRRAAAYAAAAAQADLIPDELVQRWARSALPPAARRDVLAPHFRRFAPAQAVPAVNSIDARNRSGIAVADSLTWTEVKMSISRSQAINRPGLGQGLRPSVIVNVG